MSQYIFGVDIGGTAIKIGLFSEPGKLIDKWSILTRKEEQGALILPDASASILDKCRESGIAKDNIKGIGVTVPGPVKNQRFAPVAVNLGWKDKYVADEMEKILGVCVKVGNDANVAALGEVWDGAAADYQSMIMVTLGTGVGGGVIIDKKIVEGAHGSAGEIGHAVMEPNENEMCGCGGHGHMEQYCAAPGMIRLAKRRLAEDDSASLLRDEKLSTRTIIAACEQGDQAAQEILARYTDYLGRALAAYACVVDPEVFVIGGGVSGAGNIVLDPIRENYRKYAFPTSVDTAFVIAALGNDAGIYGAARLV